MTAKSIYRSQLKNFLVQIMLLYICVLKNKTNSIKSFSIVHALYDSVKFFKLIGFLNCLFMD